MVCFFQFSVWQSCLQSQLLSFGLVVLSVESVMWNQFLQELYSGYQSSHFFSVVAAVAGSSWEKNSFVDSIVNLF